MIYLLGKCVCAIRPNHLIVLVAIFKKEHASLFYRFLLVLVFLVNFVFYLQYFQVRCSCICELKWKENVTGIYHSIQIYHHIVHVGEKQHTYFVVSPEAAIERFSKNTCRKSSIFLKLIFRKQFILYDKFCRDILKRAFYCETIYRLPEKSAGGALKMLTRSRKTIFDEDHFMVNLLYQISNKTGQITPTWYRLLIYIFDDL